ncbi:hypothetical protein QMG83_00815 [Salinibacterium sp. G-O1]|uniref:hypothetical protein n=1 Tax=Salinibacterium sp. G-O1 TaxID=3046208 RepID=UPI0024BB9AD9|nr:hypothetical protein [Salinibacterium sp. G-O1]MDJ0333756.1 hypothetical protein [Salinibacterium sp. G-O1]
MADATNVYQPNAQRPAIPKPPLLPRQKSGARLAGIIGFLLLSLGFWMFSVPLAVLAMMAVLSLVFQSVGRSSGNSDWYRQIAVFVDRLHPELWMIPLVIAVLVGMVLMAVALFVSARILRSHGIVKPWPVTWAAAGIAIVASWIASGVLSVPFQLTGIGFDNDSSQTLPLGVALGVIAFLVSIASTAVIGWLSWWWMAHVMRPAADIQDVGPAT